MPKSMLYILFYYFTTTRSLLLDTFLGKLEPF